MSVFLIFRSMLSGLILAAGFGLVPLCTAQIPAFPGAEGFGAYATGGRGGDVYTVVNLNSSGAGSLRYGIETAPSQGRTIVFAVSGYIPISYNSDTGNQTVRIVQSKVTIAGQTASGGGIGLKNGRVLVTGDNVVLRHLRIRHGKYGGAGDCLNLESSADNSIIDHVSLMFSTDENISFFNNAADDFTLQYCTSSWGMERHNAGGLWDLEDGTCHHSLWAHHRTRNPKARPYGLLEWINNVTYHWRSEGFIMGDSTTPANWRANVIGCYYLSIEDHEFGLDDTPLSKARVDRGGNPNFSIHLDDCLHDADGDGLLNGTDKGYAIMAGSEFVAGEFVPPESGEGANRYVKSATPFAGAPVPVTIDDPLTAYKKVLSSAGALRLDATYAGPLRDELDTLLVESVENQESILVAKDSPLSTNDPPSNGEALLAGPPYNISNGGFGTLNSSSAPADTDGDGMPDHWESTLGSNVSVQDHNNPVPAGAYVPNTGYTLLEEYLHFKAIPHAVLNKSTVGSTNSLTVDLRRYTRGFNRASVVFSISNVVNGIAVLQPDGYTAVFTPTPGFAGRARFDFAVLDGDGSTWTQTLAVLVNGVPALRDLIWNGDGISNVWDTDSPNFLDGTNASAFFTGDSVLFDNNGSATPNVSINGFLSPDVVEVDASQNYIFGGSGSLSGATALIKRGTGTLIIGTTNTSFGGDIDLSGGILSLSGGTSLGNGTLTIQGNATFDLATSGQTDPPNPVVIPDGESVTITSGSLGNELAGPMTGGSSSLITVGGGVSFKQGPEQFSGYSGTVVVPAGQTLRFSVTSGSNGGDNTTFDVHGVLEMRNEGTTGLLGALTGTGVLTGEKPMAGTLTFSVGAKNLDTTFAGMILDKNGPTTNTALVKVGSGALTLTGNSPYSGGTVVSSGALIVNNSSGSGTGSGAVSVLKGATLGGSGTVVGPATFAGGATLAPGNSVDLLTFGSGLTLSASTILEFEIGSSHDQVVVGGDIVAAGALEVTDSGGFSPGSYTLLTYDTNHSFTLGSLDITSAPAGYDYSFDIGTPGEVNLVVMAPIFAVPLHDGESLILSGAGGTPGADYKVLASTNLALPLNLWEPVRTNRFDGGGHFLSTNPINPGSVSQFYRLMVE